jgi:TPR repeat protein
MAAYLGPKGKSSEGRGGGGGSEGDDGDGHKNTPTSAAKMFDDACTIYFPIKMHVKKGEDGSWGPLSRQEQRQMDEVKRLWEKAAAQGLVNAQYNLGVMHENGQGVDVNYKKAFEWYEKAAKQGIAPYEIGEGVDQSD